MTRIGLAQANLNTARICIDRAVDNRCKADLLLAMCALRKARECLDLRGICHQCGCTENDCSGCIQKTGKPCYWFNDEQTLCSACANSVVTILVRDAGGTYSASCTNRGTRASSTHSAFMAATACARKIFGEGNYAIEQAAHHHFNAWMSTIEV